MLAVMPVNPPTLVTGSSVPQSTVVLPLYMPPRLGVPAPSVAPAVGLSPGPGVLPPSSPPPPPPPGRSHGQPGRSGACRHEQASARDPLALQTLPVVLGCHPGSLLLIALERSVRSVPRPQADEPYYIGRRLPVNAR